MTCINKIIKNNDIEKFKEKLNTYNSVCVRSIITQVVVNANNEMFKLFYNRATYFGYNDIFYDKFLPKLFSQCILFEKIDFFNVVLNDENVEHNRIDFNELFQYANNQPNVTKYLFDYIKKDNNLFYDKIYAILAGLELAEYRLDYLKYSKTLDVVMKNIEFDFFEFNNYLRKKIDKNSFFTNLKINNLLQFILKYDKQKTFYNKPELFLDLFNEKDLEHYKKLKAKQKIEVF